MRVREEPFFKKHAEISCVGSGCDAAVNHWLVLESPEKRLCTASSNESRDPVLGDIKVVVNYDVGDDLREECNHKDACCDYSIGKKLVWWELGEAFVDMGNDNFSDTVMEVEGTPDAELPTVEDLINWMHTLVKAREAHQDIEESGDNKTDDVSWTALLCRTEEVEEDKNGKSGREQRMATGVAILMWTTDHFDVIKSHVRSWRVIANLHGILNGEHEWEEKQVEEGAPPAVPIEYQ